MKTNEIATTKFSSVEEYIATFPLSTREVLQQVRDSIKAAAQEAEELISYNMPAFKLHGMLVYYAGYKLHIGFYPTASGISAFREELSGYKSAKGSVQFPLSKPMPVALIKKIVKYNVRENIKKANAG